MKQSIGKLLSHNVEDVIDGAHIRKVLISGKKLRVKFGIDPTGANIHIGRAVAIWKLREFQELGHQIVLIIGDFTAQIGDPSDKLEKRPFLSRADVEKNLKNYLPQIGKILDIKKTEIRYNSEWLGKLTLREVSQLADIFTFQQILERRNFSERFKKHEEISYREGLYPLMQGYDSFAIKADIELGGTDQLFNLLAGRKIQEHYGEKPQDIMTTKMVMGLDGRKMSTSWGNVINITDSPDEQFGKVMSLRDELIGEYFEAVTSIDSSSLEDIKKSLKQKGMNPMLLKKRLAFEIVKRYHGESAGSAAQEKFESLFSKKEVPSDVPHLRITKKQLSALDLIMESGVPKSRGEGRRLIENGGFEYDEETVKMPQKMLKMKVDAAVRVGKKHFYRLSTG